MKWHGVGQSDVGRKRTQNEDSFVVDEELGLFVVSDGMGGHAAGEFASAEAVRIVCQVVSEGAAAVESRDAAVELCERAVQKACGDIFRLARSDIRKAGMGCTLTVAWCRGDNVVIAHVGDSRCYLWRAGEASQITADHTVGAELAKAGFSDVAPGMAGTLSRAIGTHEAVQVDAFSISAVPGDRLLLCSDGFSNYVESVEWLGPELAGDAPDAIVEGLINHANEGGGRDNITAVLVSGEVEEHERERQETRTARLSGHLNALAGVFLFESLSIALLSRLLSHCVVTSLAPGEVVVAEGERSAQLLVVTSGKFEMKREGRVLGELTAGQHMAATTLLEPRTARASIVAAEQSTVLRLERDSFWRLVKERPWLGVNLLERLVAYLSEQLDESVSRRDDGDDETTRLSIYQFV